MNHRAELLLPYQILRIQSTYTHPPYRFVLPDFLSKRSVMDRKPQSRNKTPPRHRFLAKSHINLRYQKRRSKTLDSTHEEETTSKKDAYVARADYSHIEKAISHSQLNPIPNSLEPCEEKIADHATSNTTPPTGSYFADDLKPVDLTSD